MMAPPGLSRKLSFLSVHEDNASVQNSSSDSNLIKIQGNSRSQCLALEDGLNFITLAAKALSQDEFSKCFEPKPISRYPRYFFLYPLWIGSIFIRYCILLPIRFIAIIIAFFIILFSLPILFVTQSQALVEMVFLRVSQCLRFSLGCWIRYHGNKPPRDYSQKTPLIFVSNHTSFIDFILLSSFSYPHATVAQSHGGLFGILQNYIMNLNGSLTFHRSEKKDRTALTKKLRNHVWNSKASPMLIFPEGTCVNNEYTVLFHKGAFELDAVVVPVAIKYHKFFVDPYWNTREQTFSSHFFYLMTRWILVADVWWMAPQTKLPNETSIDFANQVKEMISSQASLINLSWNGYLKNYQIPVESQKKLQETYQEQYNKYLKKIVKRRASSPVFPSWIPESTVVDLQNKLLIDGVSLSSTSSPLVSSVRNRNSRAYSDSPSSNGGISQILLNISTQKADVLSTWRHYTKLRESQLVQQQQQTSSDYQSESAKSRTSSLSGELDINDKLQAILKKKNISLTSLKAIDHRRIENSSWRVWFKYKNSWESSIKFPDDDKNAGNRAKSDLDLTSLKVAKKKSVKSRIIKRRNSFSAF